VLAMGSRGIFKALNEGFEVQLMKTKTVPKEQR